MDVCLESVFFFGNSVKWNRHDPVLHMQSSASLFQRVLQLLMGGLIPTYYASYTLQQRSERSFYMYTSDHRPITNSSV
jgi:hypothetical protein